MIRNRLFLTLILVGTSLASGALAAEKHKRAHPQDFYARAAENSADDLMAGAPQTNARPDCFVSYSPAEVTKGIRHWTGRCH
ncbi:hypothetical protein OGR47_07230 [Methylocystis sp. MJC1]|jgi:hypothetical protein|uniref:hypothetical protein n=1 Tax=Methylocystis sp. MJC1 TaxID=2654282 RepID=UPI0013ED8A76|nr:hypothetical protein [Methylocystis sp. MJC1]KAF2992830.1 hypothetical protein MJC1_00411 [Methylocystis sp. MJC1]MBU6526789.1 hypothetical protein [Methylocystis sp. MJC1]UZX13223.1 hypothetical protein OGR47_07230 [Methylocystis sp. MJC1]